VRGRRFTYCRKRPSLVAPGTFRPTSTAVLSTVATDGFLHIRRLLECPVYADGVHRARADSVGQRPLPAVALQWHEVGCDGGADDVKNRLC
jgi:hypothetical protein